MVRLKSDKISKKNSQLEETSSIEEESQDNSSTSRLHRIKRRSGVKRFLVLFRIVCSFVS